MSDEHASLVLDFALALAQGAISSPGTLHHLAKQTDDQAMRSLAKLTFDLAERMVTEHEKRKEKTSE